jgi:hypothetical protein
MKTLFICVHVSTAFSMILYPDFISKDDITGLMSTKDAEIKFILKNINPLKPSGSYMYPLL